MSLVADVFTTTIYVIDVAGTVAVATWIITVLARSTTEQDDE